MSLITEVRILISGVSFKRGSTMSVTFSHSKKSGSAIFSLIYTFGYVGGTMHGYT